MSYIKKQVKLNKNKIDLEKSKIASRFQQELNITIHNNGLKNDCYEYRYEVSKEYNISSKFNNIFYLMASRGDFIQFSSFEKEYSRSYDSYTTYKGNGGIKFTDPIDLFELEYSKSHFNDWQTPLEGQLLIKENLIEIIKNIEKNKINLLPMYNLILEQINYYMETEEKTNNNSNYNSTAMKKSNIFDFFPMIIKKKDEIQWYIPNVIGEDIYIPFEGNLPILNNRIENILTENFEQNTRSNKYTEVHLSYSLFSNTGINLNTSLYSMEGDELNVEQVNYTLNENNNYINERKIKRYGKDSILTQLSHEIGDNDIIPMYTVTRTVIDIEETKKLLNYLDSNIKIEDIIEIANMITGNEDITIANKKAKHSHYPYISKEIRIDKDSVETYINHKLNVFIPEDSIINTFNQTKENVFVSVNIKENALNNTIKVKTFDGEELVLIEKEINELNLNQNIFQTKIYIPINKNSLLVDFIMKLDNNSRFEFVAYKNIVFTNIKNKISIPKSIIGETNTRELFIDKIYKNKDIENLNSFYISTHCFSDDIEKTQVSKNYEPNKIFLYDKKEKKIILIDMLLKKEVIFENQNNNLFLYENNTIVKSNTDLNQDFFILEDRVVMFKMDIEKERMTYQFEDLKEDLDKPFEIIEIIKNNKNTVTIPIFIPIEDTPRNFKLSENKEAKLNDSSYLKAINRKKEISEKGNLKITNYILKENKTYEEFERTIKLENFFINGEERDIDIYSTTQKELFKNEVILITINLNKFNKYRNNIKTFETIMENNKIHLRHQPKFEDIFKKTISAIRNYKTIIEEPNKDESLTTSETLDNQIENEILDNQIENNFQNKFIEKIEIPFLNVQYEKDVAFDFYSLLFKNTIKKFQFSKNKDNNVIAQISIMGNRNFDLELELITLNNSVSIMISDINDNSNNLTLIDIIKTIKKGKIDIIEKENKDIIINNNSELIYIRKDNFIDDNYMILNHNTKFKKDIQMIGFDKKLTKTIGETSILEKSGEYFFSKNGVKFYLDKSDKEIEQKIFIENFLLKENFKKNHTINLNF